MTLLSPGIASRVVPGVLFSGFWTACSVPLLDWTGDKLAELIQDQANIHTATPLVG